MEKCPFAPAKNIDKDSELPKSPVGNYSEYLQVGKVLSFISIMTELSKNENF